MPERNQEGAAGRFALLNLLGSIDAYNKEHGANWGGVFAGVLRQAGGGTEEDEARATREKFHGAQAELTKLRVKNKEAFDLFGIDVAFLSSQELDAPKAKIIVSDPRKFADALRKIGGQFNDADRVALGSLMHNLEDQIRETNFHRPSSKEKKLLGSLDDIIDAFKRIDSGQDTGRLETYEKFRKTDRLGAYITVEREGLWTEPGKGFGPGDWVKDANPQSLRSYWFKALQALRVQEKLGDKGVAEELQEHLIRCLAVSNEILPKTTYPDAHKAQLAEVLSEATGILLKSEKVN